MDRNCYACKHYYYKDEYCENLELKPCYPELGCDDFEDKGMEDIAKAFQFGLALGFGERHDEMDKVIDEIKKVITPQPKTGHWIIKDGKEQGYDIGGVKTWYIQIMCDKCGFIRTAIEGHTGQYNYCPNCGAKMVEPQERSGEE